MATALAGAYLLHDERGFGIAFVFLPEKRSESYGGYDKNKSDEIHHDLQESIAFLFRLSSGLDAINLYILTSTLWALHFVSPFMYPNLTRPNIQSSDIVRSYYSIISFCFQLL